jgi:hypothetical protein
MLYDVEWYKAKKLIRKTINAINEKEAEFIAVQLYYAKDIKSIKPNSKRLNR